MAFPSVPVTRVVIAPDKFKGSVTAAEAAAAISRGFRRVAPTIEIVEHPIADGGEGTVDAVVRAGFTRVPVEVAGPLGRPVRTSYAVRGTDAVVELAGAAGLACLPPPGPTRHTARTATTRGVGEIVRHAVDAGATSVTLGIGGSATTDGGAGLLMALGARVLTPSGAEVPSGGVALLDAAVLDLDVLKDRLRHVVITVACDVDNPLLGPAGTAAVYGAQKGASAEDVMLLDRALSRWADVIAAVTGADLRDLAGAGAAGGVGFAAAAVLGATLRPGVDLLLEVTGFGRHLGPGTLVIVGEGSLDGQSLRGKGPVGVAQAARAIGAMAVAVAGRADITPVQARLAGLEAVYTLAELEPDQARSMARAEGLLEEVAARVAAEWLGGRGRAPRAQP